ncbi:MAG: phosphoribosylformimino-5-aminoimidazole carboxamide ribotide isomerase [Thermomicrobiales bacterium]|nr:phosphoribosylformimino-5-aminoimidazole carboxamide ribotide isomerase [Thermomicrobiales bacterium]MEA2523855.1 phosphoribosylformimino-5-aminoimidazole carboxamide ribotide isomerase [Thermomicrobiales bacterium]MEA2530986.1 phosphoribosylformimino-5-aminoimidazole carboxamide ribotide isomerase [Thermomicrobiales bacterium]MEA2597110.1 phosphoribosylformimino-5-aminoimidazole carboxamide ribotide isomerase [Thermomicrobiales bacterium]
MIVYPAIDIRGGRCVRLVEGDFGRETAFDADPADAARRWAAAGAEWLHVVDLDGAKEGMPSNVEAIRKIRQAVSVPIQLGGGLRSEEQVVSAFDLGVDRVILGTAALRTPDLVARIAARWADRLAVGLDARDGRLAAAGWLDQTDAAVDEVALRLRQVGVQGFIFTDIRRDGTLTGPNLAALSDLVALLGRGVIASGGIGSVADVSDVALTGADGVIIGRALYDGRVDLQDAIAAARVPEGARC